jgi:transcriptional regulator with XRE-family HTH domain
MVTERQKIRQRAGLTLRQLSRKAKVSASRLSEFERGEVQLRDAELMRVATALELELAVPIPSTAGDIFRAMEKFRVCESRAVTV